MISRAEHEQLRLLHTLCVRIAVYRSNAFNEIMLFWWHSEKINSVMYYDSFLWQFMYRYTDSKITYHLVIIYTA